MHPYATHADEPGGANSWLSAPGQVCVIAATPDGQVFFASRHFARGIDVQPILCPGVKERAARLRFFINRTHTEDQIRHAIGIIDEEWRRFGEHSG
jgi:7-keto-8-aminopelargonate synthetase-like enzyme